MPVLKLHYFETGKLINSKGFAVTDWAVTAQTNGLDNQLRRLAYTAANIGSINANEPFPGQFGFFRVDSKFFVASYQCLSAKKETGRQRIHQGRYIMISEEELRWLNGFVWPILQAIDEDIPLRTSRALDLPPLEVNVTSNDWINPTHRFETRKLSILLTELLNNEKVYLSNLPRERFYRLALIEQIRSLAPYSCRILFTFTTSVISPEACHARIQIVDDNTRRATKATDIFGEEAIVTQAVGRIYSTWIIEKSNTQSSNLPKILDQIDRIEKNLELPAGKVLDRFAQNREIWEAFHEKALKNSLLLEDIYLVLRECPRYLDSTELGQLFSIATNELAPSNRLFQLVFTAILLIDPREDTDRLVSEVVANLLTKCFSTEPKEHLVVAFVTTFANGFLNNQRWFTKTSLSKHVRTIFEILINRNENLAVIALNAILRDPKLKSASVNFLLKEASSCFSKATQRSQFQVLCGIAQELGLRELNQLTSAGEGLTWVSANFPQVLSALALIYSKNTREVFPKQPFEDNFIYSFAWTKLLIIAALNQQKPYLITPEMISNVVKSNLEPYLHFEIMDAATRNIQGISDFSLEVAIILFHIACSTEDIKYLKFAALLLKRCVGEIDPADCQGLLTIYFEKVFTLDKTLELRQWLDESSILSIIPHEAIRNGIIDAANNAATRHSWDSRLRDAKLKELGMAKYDFEYEALKKALDRTP